MGWKRSNPTGRAESLLHPSLHTPGMLQGYVHLESHPPRHVGYNFGDRSAKRADCRRTTYKT